MDLISCFTFFHSLSADGIAKLWKLHIFFKQQGSSKEALYKDFLDAIDDRHFTMRLNMEKQLTPEVLA